MSKVIENTNDLKDNEPMEFEVKFNIESNFLLIDSGLLRQISDLSKNSNIKLNKLNMTYDFDNAIYYIKINGTGLPTNIEKFGKLVELLYERQMNDSIGASNDNKERRFSKGSKDSKEQSNG